MHFLIRYSDQPGTGEARTNLRADHIAFRKGLGDTLILAGSLLTDDGSATIGSLILIQAHSKEDAGQIATTDPYVANGVFQIDSITAYRIAAIRAPTEN